MVALVDHQEVTLKRLKHGKDHIELIPANRQMQPMRFAPERITIQVK